MRAPIRPAAVMSIVVLAACSKEGEPGSCYRAPDNACIEYGKAESASGKRMCSGLKWVPGEKSCPPANRLGMCTNNKEGSAEWLYGGPPNNYKPNSARSACEYGGGVFTTVIGSQ